jgi:hypothetical protein
MKCTVQGENDLIKNLVRQRCAEGFNSGDKELMPFTELSSVLVVYQRMGKDNQILANVFRRVRKIAKSEYQLRQACLCPSVYLFVLMEQLDSN